MKNSINTLLFTLIGAFVLCTACQQSDAILPETNTFNPPHIATNTQKSSSNPNEEGYDHTLETLATVMLPLSHDDLYRELIFDMALKGFDDEHNVIAKVLADSLRQMNRDFLQDAISLSDSSLDRTALKKAIAGMQYYDEMAFSQIFIPSIKSSFRGQMPTVVIDYGNNDAVVPGKKRETDGSEIDVLVDEAYARENLVWVISMNESLDSYEDLKLTQRTNKVIQPTGSDNVKNWTQVITTASIDEVNIDDKKEGWLSGKGEVCYAGIKFGAPNHHDTNCTIGSPSSGLPFIKIGNNDIGKWRSNSRFFASWVIKGSTPPLRADEGFFVLIWEKDKRRKKEKFIGHLPTQCSHKFSYVSNEPAYGYTSIMPHQRSFSFVGPKYTNPLWNTAMPTTNQSRNGWASWTLGYGKNLFKIKYTNL